MTPGLFSAVAASIPCALRDSTGLQYEIDLGTRSYDRDLEESLDRKDIIGSSFQFAAVEDDWSFDGPPLRSLIRAHLFDVGPVTFPAYRSATATCRSLAAKVEARAVAHAAAEVEKQLPAESRSILVALAHRFRAAEFV